MDAIDDALKAARQHFKAKRLAPAEILCRRVLETRPRDPNALEILGRIAQRIGKRAHAAMWFDRARAARPGVVGRSNAVARQASTGSSGKSEKFLLIKAWGFGFFSDVSHVIGGLLLAELTGRTPVVHWGGGSLFSDDPEQNAFTNFFEPVSDATIDDLTGFRGADYFPAKWSGKNLKDDNVRKWQGRDSRMAGLYYFNRPERVAVSDFFISVPELLLWLEEGDPYAGMPISEVFFRLIEKYLRPGAEVAERVEAFYERQLSGVPFAAAHVRGSDKAGEVSMLDEVNDAYFDILDPVVGDKAERLFLMTDSEPLLARYIDRYGERLVTTDARRTGGDTGVHYQGWDDRTRLGQEVMLDVYLALRAGFFVGNGFSNPSCMIAQGKKWKKGNCVMIGRNFQHRRIDELQFCPPLG